MLLGQRSFVSCSAAPGGQAAKRVAHRRAPGLPLSRVQWQPLYTPRRGDTSILAALGNGCPWDTLGVPHDADPPAIRRAYRKLALKHHPDVDRSQEAPKIFVAIHEAYEILTGRRRGNQAAHRPAASKGWDFHDWYWSFMSRRRQSGGKNGPAAAGAGGSQPLSTAHLREQLVGLRRKAASRAAQQRGRAAPQQPPQQEPASAREGGSGSEAPAPAPPAPAAGPAARVRSNAVSLRSDSPWPSARRAGNRQPQDSWEALMTEEGPQRAAGSAVATLERPPQRPSEEASEPEGRAREPSGDAAPPAVRSQLAGLRRRAALRQRT